ncbi:MAG: hypothetical protein CSYNP_02399 [Syntrophus sp. SKADARSKE-3]|nr:hypothetical protein [Syntrophus sp. SKADARSKE-3]
MFRVVLLIIVFIMTACAQSGPVVKTDNEQLPRQYATCSPRTPVMPEIINDVNMPWVAVDANVRRKVYFNDCQTLALIEWSKPDKGKDTVLQYHVNELTGYVLEGNLMVTIDRQTQSLGPGGVFIIPSNVHYSLLPLTAKVRYLAVFTPTREDMRRTPPPLRFDDNDIRSLVHQWFAHVDHMAAADKLLPFLSDKALTMRLPGVLIKSRDDFKTWYTADLKKMKSVACKVEQIKVKTDKNNSYIVDMTVSRKAVTVLSEDRSYRSHQVWVFTDMGGTYPLITYMDVDESTNSAP